RRRLGAEGGGRGRKGARQQLVAALERQAEVLGDEVLGAYRGATQEAALRVAGGRTQRRGAVGVGEEAPLRRRTHVADQAVGDAAEGVGAVRDGAAAEVGLQVERGAQRDGVTEAE